MAEKNLDFDVVIDRTNTNCLKYDFAVKRGKPKDVLPLWVADMDFPTSSYVQDALIAQAVHGIYGYSDSLESYFEAVRCWFLEHYHWEVKEQWLVKTPGVVYALAQAIQAFTEEGDAVLIQRPVYYPFTEVVEDNNRRLVNNPLYLGEDGRYHIDFADLEHKIESEHVKLFLLCNPHNPVGRAWSREELERMGDICLRHGVLVVSDEIHADYVLHGTHQVFANIKEAFANISVTCTSPSKTFNIPGLQVSNIFIPNEVLRKKFEKRMAAGGYSQVNAAGIVACEAAYRYGSEWHQAVRSYICDNVAYVKEFLAEHLPELTLIEPEATYLLWLDFRALGLNTAELEKLIVEDAGLWLDGGAIFGEEGVGFERINAACPRATLTKALEKLEHAIHKGTQQKGA